MITKKVSDSITQRDQIVMSAHLNGSNRLFGGQLAMWIDEVAGITAMRHTGGQIVTACIDNLQFREQVVQGELLVLIGQITYVGHSSMEVRVDSYVEAPHGQRRLINTAYLVEVAIDPQGRPIPAPKLLPETAAEKEQWQAAQRRRKHRASFSPNGQGTP